MASRRHESSSLVIVGVLEADLIRDQLIMEPRCSQCLGSGHVLIENVPEILQG